MSSTSIKQKLGPVKFYLWSIFALMLATAIGYGSGYAITEHMHSTLATQTSSIDQLNQENNRLNRQLNIIGVELEIEKRANQQAQQDLQKAIEENQQTREELSFYQKVMAPELNEDGFVIDSLDIEPLSVDGHFRLAMVLMQQDRRKSVVKGSLTLSIKGSKDGKPAQLNWQDIRQSGSSLGFQFRYFEVLKGDFALPAGFIPERIEVVAKLNNIGSKGETYQRSFDWQVTSRDSQEN